MFSLPTMDRNVGEAHLVAEIPISWLIPGRAGDLVWVLGLSALFLHLASGGEKNINNPILSSPVPARPAPPKYSHNGHGLGNYSIRSILCGL